MTPCNLHIAAKIKAKIKIKLCEMNTENKDTKMENVLDINNVKKELYKSKVNAKLECVREGRMYYSVQLESGTYMFPIDTVEKVNTTLYRLDPKTQSSPSVDLTYTRVDEKFYTLSAELGITDFGAEMKGSDLNRWIAKAIEKDEFVKIK